MAGRVVHFEIPYDDGARARSFYEKAFGWQATVLPEMDYTMVTVGPTEMEQGPAEAGFINGGMMQREADWTTPNIVIDTENIEQSLDAVSEAGGTVVAKRMPVGDMGFTAYFRDTEGNLVGLWETAPQG